MIAEHLIPAVELDAPHVIGWVKYETKAGDTVSVPCRTQGQLNLIALTNMQPQFQMQNVRLELRILGGRA